MTPYRSVHLGGVDGGCLFRWSFVNVMAKNQLAEVAIPRWLFVEILRLIDGLRPKPAPT
jgi:hypothetical protein